MQLKSRLAWLLVPLFASALIFFRRAGLREQIAAGKTTFEPSIPRYSLNRRDVLGSREIPTIGSNETALAANQSGYGSADFTVNFASDGSTVPETNSLCLMAGGLGALSSRWGIRVPSSISRRLVGSK